MSSPEASGVPTTAERLAGVRTRLNGAYGERFVWYLVVVYLGLKGGANQLVTSAMLPMYQKMGVSSTDYQLAAMIAGTPWAAKGWLGVLSDCFPLGAYHKRNYLLASSALGAFGSACLLLVLSLGLGAEVRWVVAVLFVLPQLHCATFDLLCEGKYTELMRDERAGSEVLSLVWVCISAGGLLGAGFVAGTVDRYGAQPLIAISMVPGLYSAWLTARGSMPELVLPPKRRGVQWVKLKSEPRLFFLAFCMAAGALIVSALGALSTSDVQIASTLLLSCGLCVLSFYTLPRVLAKGNLYMFLMSVAYVDLSGPLGYYYTAKPSCIPDGPHFSYAYYLAVTAFVGAISGVLGSALFQRIQSWTFRRAFMITTVVQVSASIFDIAIVKRWNRAVGLSDSVTYLFGDAACQNLVAALQNMPGVLLTTRLCPRGAEATVYAILAGFQNFGGNVASVLGVWLTRTLDVRTSVGDNGNEPCDIERLGTAIVIAHMLLPLMCLPLTFCLCPSVRMNDETAFEDASPPPSFRSPAASDSGSNPSTPCSIGEGQYLSLPEGPHDFLDEDFIMTDTLCR